MALAPNALTTFTAVQSVVSGLQAGDQAAVERLINVYSQSVEKYCNRSFGKAVIVGERYARPAQIPVLVLRRRPVLSIEKLVVGDQELTSGTDFYVENAEAGIIRFKRSIAGNALGVAGSAALDTLPGSGELDVLVDYTAGYVLPKDEAVGPPAVVRTLPFDIEDAVIQCVSSAWHRRGADVASSGYTQGGPEAPWVGGPIPGPVLPTLKRYQRWV